MVNETINQKQSIFDFLRAHGKAMNANELVTLDKGRRTRIYYCDPVVKIDDYREILTIKYKTSALTELFGREPFTYELVRDDFPNRNLIPVYGRGAGGKSVIVDYVQGEDSTPSPKLQSFLESGGKCYIPGKLENSYKVSPTELLSVKAVSEAI